MNNKSVTYVRKGLKIVEDCLTECRRMHLDLNVFSPSLKIMNMLLAEDYLKLHFNSEDPNDDVLVFHNSEDKYAHNGDIRMNCFLSQSPKVLEHVRKHKKVSALIKELNKRKEVKK